MVIKWSNIAFFVLVVFTFAWAVREQDSIFSFLSRMGQLGPEHPTDERFWGLMVFGLLVITLVGVLRILIASQTRP
jgi:hypothetical protein